MIAESMGRALTVLIFCLPSGFRKVGFGVFGSADLLGPVLGVMADRANHRSEDRDDAERPQERLPELHSPGHVRIGRQAIPIRMVAVREDGDDARALDSP